MELVIMGAPGAGKGTQAVIVGKEYGIAQISTGEMFRKAVESGTELGKIAKEYLTSGGLVPDEVTIGLVRERLKEPDCEQGFILDGFPRTVEQAEALNKLLAEKGKRLTIALNISVGREYLLERALGRRVCRKCGATYNIKYKPSRLGTKCEKCGGELYQRRDDNAETLENRLSAYEESTRPLIEYYKKAGIYREVDGRQAISKVSEDVKKLLMREQ